MSREHLRQRLVERAGLLLGVADGREDVGAVLPGELGGVVGAVVGDDHHPVRRPGLPPQRLQRRRDRERLVVRRHQHRQPQRRRCAPSSLSGSLLGGSSGSSASRTVDGPSGVNSSARSLRISGESGVRNPPVPRQDPHRRRRMQSSEPDEERCRGRAGSQDQRDRRNVVVGTERKLADDVPRLRPERDPQRQQQQHHGQADQRDGQPTQPRNPPDEVGGSRLSMRPKRSASFSLQALPTTRHHPAAGDVPVHASGGARCLVDQAASKPKRSSASRAASCSASFFDRPCRPDLLPVDHRGAGEGPLVRRPVGRRAPRTRRWPRLASSSWSSVLWSTWVVSAYSIRAANASTIGVLDRRRSRARGRARARAASSSAASTFRFCASRSSSSAGSVAALRSRAARRGRAPARRPRSSPRDDVRADLRQPPLGEVRVARRRARARSRARARCRRGTRAARTTRPGRRPRTSGVKTCSSRAVGGSSSISRASSGGVAATGATRRSRPPGRRS